ncbi:MAG: sulfatase-like hydrolase/transferase [Coraliomargarita sp.]
MRILTKALSLAACVCGVLLQAEVPQERPNILWITSEDNGIKWVGAYGGVNAATPNIDQLAAEGFRYTFCLDNAAVCAPTRSSWITGMHAISIGTDAMRSAYEVPEQVIFYNHQLQVRSALHEVLDHYQQFDRVSKRVK